MKIIVLIGSPNKRESTIAKEFEKEALSENAASFKID